MAGMRLWPVKLDENALIKSCEKNYDPKELYSEVVLLFRTALWLS